MALNFTHAIATRFAHSLYKLRLGSRMSLNHHSAVSTSNICVKSPRLKLYQRITLSMARVMEFPQTFPSVIFTVVIMIAGAANFGGVAAQTSGCATSLATLSPCMGYITSNATTSPPLQSCCTALSSVLQNNAVCLCQLLTTSSPLGFPINQTQALALPGACKTTTPALTQCKVAGVPAPSPATGSSNGASPTTETAPSSSPATPNAVSPSSNSPSLLPPTTSVRGISPTDGERPTSKAGALFTPSMIISALAVAMVASSMW